ncbi:hypothetical protein [Leptolyngbya ohadii]|uniref:hypothetical protein n=1 Tax=Leptolyngbya ohadii TaxID=1962290 RepID=UPI0015C61E38|nr:hypothetical protein [Leptolyngbya ohadii]
MPTKREVTNRFDKSDDPLCGSAKGDTPATAAWNDRARRSHSLHRSVALAEVTGLG